MKLPTGSGVEAAIRCPPSTIFQQVRSLFGDFAEKGTWKHAFAAAVHNKVPYEKALELVPVKYRSACESLDLQRILRMPNLVAEESFAYDVATGRARSLGFNVDRQYEVSPNEIAMTLDYSGIDVTGTEVIVVDLKTGFTDVTPAARNWQVRAGAIALARLYGVQQALVALVHAREGMRPWWDVAVLDALDLDDAANDLSMLPFRLEAAEMLVAAGKQPELNAGEWCRRCPARRTCPATTALIHQMVGHPGKFTYDMKALITPQNAHEVYNRMKVVKGIVAEVEGHLRAFANETPFMINDETVFGPVVHPVDKYDGEKTFNIIEQLHDEEAAKRGVAFEASKASIERAVRPVWEAKTAAGEKTADGKRITLKSMVDEVLESLKMNDGITKEEKHEVREHKLTADEKLAMVVQQQREPGEEG